MRATVIGCGAIGSVAAAGLFRAGYDLLLVDADPDHVAAINRGGLLVEEAEQTHRVRAPAITPDRLAGPQELVILAIKSQHTQGALEPLIPHLRADGAVLSLQNGLNPDLISDQIGVERTMAAFVNIQAAYVEPGRVRCGRTGSFYLGEQAGAITPRLRALAAALGQIRPVHMTDNIQGYLWSKMAYAAVLVLSALVDAPVHDTIERYPHLLQAAAGEVAGAAVASGVRLERFDFVDPIAMLENRYDFSEMARDWRAREMGYSGIWRDIVVRRRRTEVPAQLGQVVKMGERAGAAMPITRRLIQVITEIEEGRRPMGWENLNELQQMAEGR